MLRNLVKSTKAVNSRRYGRGEAALDGFISTEHKNLNTGLRCSHLPLFAEFSGPKPSNFNSFFFFLNCNLNRLLKYILQENSASPCEPCFLQQQLYWWNYLIPEQRILDFTTYLLYIQNVGIGKRLYTGKMSELVLYRGLNNILISHHFLWFG